MGAWPSVSHSSGVWLEVGGSDCWGRQPARHSCVLQGGNQDTKGRVGSDHPRSVSSFASTSATTCVGARPAKAAFRARQSRLFI